MADASDLELLKLEMETLWGADAFGRELRPRPLVAVAVAGACRSVSFNSYLSPDLRSIEVEQDLLCHDPGNLSTYSQTFAQCGPTILRGCLSFVFEGISLPTYSQTAMSVLTSGNGDLTTLRIGRPDSWGDEDEWAGLLDGQFGPWAVGLVADRIVSVCYTPVASSVAAETGLWTQPEERGHGYGGIVTLEWARVAAPHFETLFYSTSFENVASQAVARKLRLRPIGYIWQLHLGP